MRAVVLVGGLGTRLRPLTRTRPKQLLPVLDRPMINHVVEGLACHGVTEVVLALGYRSAAFRAAYPEGRCAGVVLRYVVEPEPLDTAGAIAFAADRAGIDETFVAVNGDVITDLDLTAMLQQHHRVGASATIHLAQVADPSRYGVVSADDSGRVLGFVEKPPAGSRSGGWINAGCYVLEPTLLDGIARDRRVSIEREVFPQLAGDGGLWALRSDAYWVDCGTPASYLQVQLDLLDGVRGDPANGLAATARVAADAVVERSVVMADVRVEPGAVVRRAALQPGSRIAAGAVVEASLIGSGVLVGANARICDGSVIGDGVVIDPGAQLFGVRVPE